MNDPNEELQVRNRQIAAVHAISRQLNSTLDVHERMANILQVCMDAVDAVAGTVFLHKPEEGKLVFTYVVGEKARELTGRAIDETKGVVGLVFKNRVGRIDNRPKESSTHLSQIGKDLGFTTESILTVPLMVQSGMPVGVIQLLNKRSGEFQDRDLQVLEIVAAISAAAIENARLFDEAQVAALAHRVGDLSHTIKNQMSPIPMAMLTLQPTIDSMLVELDEVSDSVPPDASKRLQDATAAFRKEFPEYFGMIMDASHVAISYTKLIADTLKGGVSAVDFTVQELGPIIERQISSLDRVAKTRDVALVLDLQPVPPFAFDIFHVEGAVYNLVNNALPETPRGGKITVRAWGPESLGPDGAEFVTIEVADTGRGMPAEKLHDVLRGNAKSDKPGGTGLGTRLIYKSVEVHKGRFEGESWPGVGTTLRMRLPFRTAA